MVRCKFRVGELAIAIVGIIKVLPASLAEIHAVEGADEAAPRDDIGMDERNGLVGAFHELAPAVFSMNRGWGQNNRTALR